MLIYPVVSFLLSCVFYILRIILPFHQNIFRSFTNKKMDISKIIHDRSTPCIANQIRIRIFINDGYQVVFCISAVTRDDDMIFAVKFRHNLPDHGGCQFQFRLFFSATYDNQEERKDEILYPHSRQVRRAWLSQSSVHSDSWNRCVRLSIDNISRNKVSAVGTEKFQNRSKNIAEVCLSVFFRCIMFLPYRVTFLCNVLYQNKNVKVKSF